MSKNINRLLLCSLCIAAILLLAFGVNKVSSGYRGSRGTAQICLLYENTPEKDKSLHREEDFDPAGKRVIWEYQDLAYYHTDFSLINELTLEDPLGDLAVLPCNENAWFSVSVWEDWSTPAARWEQALRNKGAYVSVNEEGRLVGFMTGGQILSLKDENTPFYVGMRSRPGEAYAAELRESFEPLTNPAEVPLSDLSWCVFSGSAAGLRYQGGDHYTGPMFHISSQGDLEKAFECGGFTDSAKAVWRQKYNKDFFPA